MAKNRSEEEEAREIPKRRSTISGGVILSPDKGNMQETLKSIARNPNPERSTRPLLKRGEENRKRDENKSEVPYHVKEEKGPGVGTVSSEV